MSEPKKKTQQDLLNDEKFIATLVDYNLDRYGEVPLSAEEALDQFIEDYRSLQSDVSPSAILVHGSCPSGAGGI